MRQIRVNLPHRNNSGSGFINLTSLIDIMTILLVFIVLRMGTGGVTDFSTNDLTLPPSFSSEVPQEMEDMVVVSVGKEGVVVDNNPVMTTKSLIASPVGIIHEVEGALREHRQREERMVQMGFQSRVSNWVKVLGDESLTFVDMLKIMRTCSEVGYEHVFLGAIGV